MQVLEGTGWRLAVDLSRRPYPVLVGGDGWAFELSALEARALAGAAASLVAQHRQLVDQLMAEEAITLEYEGPVGDHDGHLWLGLEGDRSTWNLRVVLSPVVGSRAVEGCWRPAAAAAFVAALTSHPEIVD
ncbi:MAG: DUF1818 family protein [Cyanobacteriota bacterium]|nr:DUF1818 family protein [Cyanobacteriota bacterium]